MSFLHKPLPFVQLELLVHIWVVIGVEFGYVGVFGPVWIVNSSPADLELVVGRFPAWNFAVREDSPWFPKGVTQLESSINDDIFIAAEAVSMKFDVVNGLSQAVRLASSNEVNTV